jgi:hypothetical protein
MEITLQVTGISKLKRKLTDIHTRQLPFATAKALTLTAKSVSEAERMEIPQVFKSPTPYTQNSIAFTPATKQTLTARVFVKDRVSKGGTPPARYLLPEVRGGDRNLKHFEKTLRDTGVLPTGLFAVPGRAAEMDQYGNMSRKQIGNILAYFQGFRGTKASRNYTGERIAKLARGTRKTAGFAYFVASDAPVTKHLTPGIYRRSEGKIEPVVVFVKQPAYSKRFDFFGVVRKVAGKEFQANFNKAFQQAIATAR